MSSTISIQTTNLVLFFLVINLCLIRCNEERYNQPIAVQSYNMNVESIEINNSNKIKLKEFQDSIFAKQIIELTDEFEKYIFDLTSKLVIASGGYRFYQEEGYWTNELSVPNDLRSTKQIMEIEGNENDLEKLISNHFQSIKEILETNETINSKMLIHNLDLELDKLLSESNKFSGVNVSEAILRLSKLNRAEKDLIQKIVEEITPN